MNAVRAVLCCALLLVWALGPICRPGSRQGDRRLARRPGPALGHLRRRAQRLLRRRRPRLELNFAQSGAAVTQQLTGGSLDVALSVGITDPIRAIEKGAPLALDPRDRQLAALRADRQARPQVDHRPQRQDHLGRRGQRHHHRLFRADDGGERLQEGRLRHHSGGCRGRALCRAEGRRRRCRDRATAAQLPGRRSRLRHARPDGRLREGRSVHRHGGAPALGHGESVGRQAVLAATDKSIAWLADPAHRGEAIELLVKVGRSSKEDAEASYDYLRRIDFFEPTSKVSRTKLRNLVAMEQRAGTVDPAFDIERLAMPGLTELTD